MKKFVVAACALLLTAGTAFSQTAPAKVLDQATLDRFLADFPRIGAEGEAAGISPGESVGQEASPALEASSVSQMMRDALNSMKNHPESRKLLEKHGWDDSFWDIYFTVGMSYGIISTEDSLQGQPLPEEIKPMIEELRATVHPNDLELVRLNIGRIQSVLEGAEQE